MDKSLLYPAFAYLVYIWMIVLVNFFARKKAIRSKEVSHKYFKTYDFGELPRRLVILGRHLDNQFQLPTIFLVTCVALTQMGDINPLTISLAWGFFASRIVHGYIHLTSNNILRRAGMYALGWLFVLLLWTHLIFLL